MQQSSRLRVHGRITAIEPEATGAATTRVEVDSRESTAGGISRLESPMTVYFFNPNYWPPFFTLLDRVWLSFEIYADSKSITVANTRRVEFRAISNTDKCEYKMSGELFLWPKSGSRGSVYFDCGVPMLLTAGRDISGLARTGSTIEISKGRIYGQVDRPSVYSMK